MDNGLGVLSVVGMVFGSWGFSMVFVMMFWMVLSVGVLMY